MPNVDIVFPSVFMPFNKWLFDSNDKCDSFSLYSGRGGGKSSTLYRDTGLLLLQGKGCVLYVRRYKNTISGSSLAGLRKVFNETGISELFKFTESPMRVTCKLNGYCVQFIGLDDYQKIKSLEPALDRFAMVVFEEAQEIMSRAPVDEVKNTIQRGSSSGVKFVYMFNPPPQKKHWLNQEFRSGIDGRLKTLHTSYEDLPVEMIGQKFIDEAEYWKEANYRTWLYRYGGEPISTDDVIFENVVISEIKNEQIADWLRNDEGMFQGLDFGYYPDANAGNLMHYDRVNRDLYIFNEYHSLKKNNLEISAGLADAGILKEYRMTCDNNEKDIADLRDFGWDARAAIKGPNSRDSGFKWLQGLNHIFIDDTRCPCTAEEFIEYHYEQDKTGVIKSIFPEGQADHHIAAARYAMESTWRKKGQ